VASELRSSIVGRAAALARWWAAGFALVSLMACSGGAVAPAAGPSEAQLAAYFGAGARLGFAAASQRRVVALDTLRAPNPMVGEALFFRYCVDCHGRGDRGRRFAKVQRWGDSAINTIRFGLGDMPAFENRLSREQMRDIVAYLERRFK